MADLTGRELALAPRWRFVPAEHLTEKMRARLGAAAAEPDCGGVLLPRRGSHGAPILVAAGLVPLVEALRWPGPVSPAVSRRLGGSGPQILGGLILDGVIAVRDGGAWMSGAAAFPLVCPAAPPRATGPTARLAEAALRYGAQLSRCDARVLASRLYRYHTLAASPRWRRVLPADEETVAAFEGAGRRGVLWLLAPRVGAAAGWHLWRCARARRGAAPGRPVFKLYVSPASGAVRRVLPIAGASLAASRAFAVKVGAGVPGLLRPDKIVAYFPDWPSLHRASLALASDLRGVAAHGVPFTAALTPSGLLSWGIDPPPDVRAFGVVGRGSWRSWICAAAATALVEARSAEAPAVAPWRFALARLALEGIDVATFTPRGPWYDAAAS